MKFHRVGVIVGILVIGWASTSTIRAQNSRTLDLSFNDGQVTLIANNVTLREILAEWARKGGSTIVNAEKLGGSPVVMMEFKEQPEVEVLRSLLRDAPGYGIALRANMSADMSTIGTVFVLATRSAAVSSSYAAPQATQPANFQGPAQPLAAPRLIQGSPDDEILPVRPMQGNMPPMTPGASATPDPTLRTGAGGVVTSTVPGVIIPVQGVEPTIGGRGRSGGRQGGGGGGIR
ncbi:MAG: hypothetical protein HQ485_02610 [Acidobacteria bacterium]|nr:hypothetical protein [Acidobacteriota bacterium]